MARGVFSTSNYLLYSGGIITTTPLTIALMVNPASFPANQYLAGIFYTSAGSGTNQDGWVVELNSTNGVVNAITGDGTGIYIASAGAASAGAWNHVAGKFISSTSRYAYLNGTPGSQNTNSKTPTAPDKTVVGVLIREDNVTQQAATACHIAEVGFWNIDLTDAEIGILAKGISPLLVRPQSLVAYYPLIRGDASGDEPNPKNAAFKLVEQGTVSVQPHPRVFYPNPRPMFKRASAAAGGWSNIAKVNGVLSSSLSKANGVAVASISKINGVSV